MGDKSKRKGSSTSNHDFGDSSHKGKKSGKFPLLFPGVWFERSVTISEMEVSYYMVRVRKKSS